jgi:hypothetical protein
MPNVSEMAALHGRLLGRAVAKMAMKAKKQRFHGNLRLEQALSIRQSDRMGTSDRRSRSRVS